MLSRQCWGSTKICIYVGSVHPVLSTRDQRFRKNSVKIQALQILAYLELTSVNLTTILMSLDNLSVMIPVIDITR